MCACMCACVCVCVCVCKCMGVCMHVYVGVCMCACVCVCVGVFVCVKGRNQNHEIACIEEGKGILRGRRGRKEREEEWDLTSGTPLL